MKKIILLGFIAINLLAIQNRASAQVVISANVNISSQPIWGPVGYDYAKYYYMPDIDAYYSVQGRQFIYLEGNRWIFASSLPGRFHYNLYGGYKVVVNDDRPYMHPENYRQKYASYKGGHEKQVVIRDSREEKYYVVRGHPMHAEYIKTHHDNDNNGNNGHRQKKDKDHKNKNHN